MIVRECEAKRTISYNMPALNSGRTRFMQGERIFVSASDFARMERQSKVSAVPGAPSFETSPKNPDAVFPKRRPRAWVFGDGPTATLCRDLVDPESDVVFAVNHCFYEPLSLVPDYYVALDLGMLEKERGRILDLPAIRKFTNRTNNASGRWSAPGMEFFDVPSETGFSDELLVVHHGKTSCYCALQLAYQAGIEFEKDLEIHLAGIDLAVLDLPIPQGKIRRVTHHYGQSAYQEHLFPRMLAAIRLGLEFLNSKGVRWVNHSPLLASRIEDLKYGDS